MSSKHQGECGAPEFSILIGMVSTEDSDRIIEALDSLRNQQGKNTYEVIVADRRNDIVGDRIDAEYPEAMRIACKSSDTLPYLRARALEHATGQYIVVIEDHNVPSQNWLQNFKEAYAKAAGNTAAVGGCVENGVCDTSLDWATFFCEYSFFIQPVEEGESKVLPGMNIAYKKEIIKGIERDALINGFWETTVHPLLLERGHKFYSTNQIKIYHSKKFSFWLFARQRFVYSRYYAGLRFPKEQLGKRIVACFATLLLPPLLVYRSLKQIKLKKRLWPEFKKALPLLLLFYVVWAYGEMVGYMFGGKNALVEIE